MVLQKSSLLMPSWAQLLLILLAVVAWAPTPSDAARPNPPADKGAAPTALVQTGTKAKYKGRGHRQILVGRNADEAEASIVDGVHRHFTFGLAQLSPTANLTGKALEAARMLAPGEKPIHMVSEIHPISPHDLKKGHEVPIVPVDAFSHIRDSWCVVSALGTLMVAAVLPIAFNQGLTSFFLVVIYLGCLTMVQLTVKAALQSGFPYPYSITASHMLLTGLVAVSFQRLDFRHALKALPVSISNGLSLTFGNTALVFGSVAFVAMISSCSPASTCALEVITRRRDATKGTVFAVMIACLGGVLCVRGENHFNVLALTFCLLAATCRSSKIIWQHDLLKEDVAPLTIVAWNSIWSLLLIVPLVVYYEGTSFFHQALRADRWALAMVASSAVTGTVLNIAQCFALRYVGPLMQHVLGNLQLIMVILLASVWFHETVAPVQWLGCVLIIAGVAAGKKLHQPRDAPKPGQLPLSVSRGADDNKNPF